MISTFKSDESAKKFDEESKSEHTVSLSSSYLSSEFGSSAIITDESAGIDGDVKKLKKKQKVEQNRLLKIIEVREMQLNQCKKQIDAMNELLLSFQTKEKRSEQSEKQIIDPKKESIKKEAGVITPSLERLENIYKENIDDVKNIEPSQKNSKWIIPIISKLTADDLQASQKIKIQLPKPD